MNISPTSPKGIVLNGIQRRLAFTGRDNETRFNEFLERHDWFFAEFVQRALALRAKGYGYYSADAIAHGMRVDRDLHFSGTGQFKLDNNIIAFVARKAIKENHVLEGFFRTRRQTAA